jgi:hypothetical protein
MTNSLPTSHTKRVADFLNRVQASHRGRVIFALDATASRQSTWDTAVKLQADMFVETDKIGGLEVQLVYYRGLEECKAGRWTIDTHELANAMSRITCVSGQTQIGRILAHVRKEHAQQPVNAVVFIGDMVEEPAHGLYDAAAGCPPIFIFQEGPDVLATQVFGEMARLTKGAYSKFTPGSARELADLLRAVAAFAAGGLTALSDLRTDAARKLLEQVKK